MTQPLDNTLTGPIAGTLDNALAEIERIGRLQDAPLRNLLITQTYCDLSHGLATVTGAGNANWSSFATWASKTAGQTIRGDEVPREVAALLRDEAHLEAHLANLKRRRPVLLWIKADLDVFDIARAVIAEVSQQIAVGNLKVFAELAPLFARFFHTFSDPRRRTTEALQAFVAQLKPGPAASDGQDSLKVAFTSYFAAASATTSKERAELILYGNLLIGLHEQTRLQPNIKAAIDAPLSPQVYKKLAAGSIWAWPGFHTLFGWQVKLMLHAIQDPWERIVTRHMMRLTMPNGGSMALGQDVTLAGSRAFPLDLDPLHHPDLIALIRTYDPNLETLKGSGARNWTNLGNRMAFIADLFRSRQCTTSMFDPPFNPTQVEMFRGGRIPTGPL
jgi:hypothetical protein